MVVVEIYNKEEVTASSLFCYLWGIFVLRLLFVREDSHFMTNVVTIIVNVGGGVKVG